MQTIETFVNLLVDTNLDALETFALDHAEVFEGLGALDFTDIKITELSANRIEGQLGDYSIAMFGGQIEPAGSLEDLLGAVDTAFADASFTQFNIIGPEQDLLEFSLTDNGYVVQTGGQVFSVVGAWPSSMANLAETLNALVRTDRFDDTPETLSDWIRTSGLTEFTVTDQGLPVLAFRSTADTASLATGGLSLMITQGEQGQAKTIAFQIQGVPSETAFIMETGSANLADLPYTIPEIVMETGLAPTQQELDRIAALAEQTYISFSLSQPFVGPYTFDLNILIDGYFADQPDPVISGTADNDLLQGTAARELFVGGAGDDIILGGDGEDSARFSGLAGDFKIDVSTDGVVVQDLRSDGEDRDLLRGVETLKFDDRFISLGDLDWLHSIRSEQIIELVQLYVAYLGRLPDAQGMLFWLATQNAGLTREEIATHFFNQPEAIATDLGGLSITDFIEGTYATVFGREADAEGAAFWGAALSDGEIDRKSFVLALLDGAVADDPQGRDATHLENLSTLGISYALGSGLTDVSDATTLVERFNAGNLEMAEALSLIAQLGEQALMDPTELSISISAGTADFF